MIIIPISFTYNEIDYTASVQKFEAFKTLPIQYLLFDIKPELNVQSTIYLVSKNRKGPTV